MLPSPNCLHWTELIIWCNKHYFDKEWQEEEEEKEEDYLYLHTCLIVFLQDFPSSTLLLDERTSSSLVSTACRDEYGRAAMNLFFSCGSLRMTMVNSATNLSMRDGTACGGLVFVSSIILTDQYRLNEFISNIQQSTITGHVRQREMKWTWDDCMEGHVCWECLHIHETVDMQDK